MTVPSLLAQAKAGDPEAIAALVNRALQPKGITVRGDRQREQLTLWVRGQVLPPQAATVHYLRQGIERLHIQGLQRLEIYGAQIGNLTAGWHQIVELATASPTAEVQPRQQTADLPDQEVSEADTDLFSFQNRQSNTLLFPALMVLGMIMNALPIVNFLLRGVKIWFHEFGHATIAWLAGRQAIPLPFGWTNVNPQRSLLVYLGLLVLFGLLYWSGQREGRRWPMVLAAVLVVLQFWMTWVVSADRFDMLLSFGGIGGELYLCVLLMVSFYFPLPEYWRWDVYRYPVVLGAAFTFWGQFWLWKQIARGKASIPFGSMWGGPVHGDMNRLVNVHSWSPGQIVDTYNAIANVCLLGLLSVYIYFFLKHNRQFLFALSQRWIARS